MSPSTAGTITVDLQKRIDRFVERYGSAPDKLPITLDEWAWLGLHMAYEQAIIQGSSRLPMIPREFKGIRLRLVELVVGLPDGSLLVRP